MLFLSLDNMAELCVDCSTKTFLKTRYRWNRINAQRVLFNLLIPCALAQGDNPLKKRGCIPRFEAPGKGEVSEGENTPFGFSPPN